jgi:hypothetical protein
MFKAKAPKQIIVEHWTTLQKAINKFQKHGFGIITG